MPAITKGMMSSLTDEWSTPHYVFDRLNEEFHFETDVCAGDLNHKCDRYFTKKEDGLKQDWKGVCWCNPPYGRTIGQWVKKACESARGGGGGCLPTPSTHGYQMVEGLRHVCV